VDVRCLEEETPSLECALYSNDKTSAGAVLQQLSGIRFTYGEPRSEPDPVFDHEVNLTPFLIILQGKWSDPFTGYVLMNLIPYFGASEDRDTGTPGRTRFNFLRPLLRVSRKAQATTGR
jgi:hypothetical protein